MGRVSAEALRSSNEFAYVGGLARRADPSSETYDALETLLEERKPDVLLDFTTRPDSVEISMAALVHGVRPVVGASGWTDAETETLSRLAEERGLGAMIVPNFSTGAALMLCFARAAASYFPAAEIVEMHRSGKKDKPSGTALATAANIERGGGARPEIHSVRLPGLIAHQEVMFSGPGELLTIRHDSLARESFVPGIFAALRAVMRLRGLVVGLDTIVDALATARVTSST